MPDRLVDLARLALLAASPDDTAQLARALALLLIPGDTLLLSGDLGAGKTTLVRSLVRASGCQSPVSSPTFVIAHEHTRDGAPPIVHIDAYRLDPDADLALIGWDRLAAPDTTLLIEWPQRLAASPATQDRLTGPRTGTLTLAHAGSTSRIITLDAPPAWTRRSAWHALADLARQMHVPTDVADTHTATHDTPPRTATTCPITGRPVPADSPTWPFADERARMADLYRWFSGSYTITRPVEQRDLDLTD